jgi:hypothetical protein
MSHALLDGRETPRGSTAPFAPTLASPVIETNEEDIMEIQRLKISHLFAAACAVLLLGACDAGTEVDEAELQTDADMTIAENDPAYDTGLAGDSVFAQARLADLDTNQDGQVGREEFDIWFAANVASDWGSEADPQVAHADLADDFWSWWDTNGDDAVDRMEYDEARATFAFENVDYGDFEQVAGDDQRLSRDEFDAWFHETVWSSWATGSEDRIGRDDLADRFWHLFDENGDDRLDEQEVNRFGDAGTATAERMDQPLTDLGAS